MVVSAWNSLPFGVWWLPTINCFEILLRLVVELLGFLFEFLKSSLCVDVDGIFGVFANIKALLERLRRSGDGLAHAFQAHLERRTHGLTDVDAPITAGVPE